MVTTVSVYCVRDMIMLHPLPISYSGTKSLSTWPSRFPIKSSTTPPAGHWSSGVWGTRLWWGQRSRRSSWTSRGWCWSVVPATRVDSTRARVSPCVRSSVFTARVSDQTRVNVRRDSVALTAQNVRFLFTKFLDLKTSNNSVCEPGRWGPGCVRTCPCENGATCDPVSGDCQCTAGYEGATCDHACQLGYYGQGCREKCRCKNGERGKYFRVYTKIIFPMSGGVCDHVSGACRCDKGWQGAL